MSESENGKPESAFGDFVSLAVRRPKQDIFEQLVTQHLIAATFAQDPLKTIYHICSAALMAGSEKMANYEKLKVILETSIGLQNVEKSELPTGELYVRVSWPFPLTEQNFEIYIKPWFRHVSFWRDYFKNTKTAFKVMHSCGYIFGSYATREEAENARQKLNGACPSCEELLNEPSIFHIHSTYVEPVEILNGKSGTFFFEICKQLTVSGYLELCNSFVVYALPFVLKVKTELSKMVNPDVYRELLAAFTGKISKTSSEAESFENTLG